MTRNETGGRAAENQTGGGQAMNSNRKSDERTVRSAAEQINANHLNNPYTSAIMIVPDNTLANKRRDREIGTAISLMILIGNQIGSHAGSGEHIPFQISFGF